ncbi:hypothetical protein D3C86_1829910 [compost metagenome]
MDEDESHRPEGRLALQVLDLVVMDVLELEAGLDLGLLGLEVDAHGLVASVEVAEVVRSALLLREDLGGGVGTRVVFDDRPADLGLFDVGQAFEAVLLVDGLDGRLEAAATVCVGHSNLRV